MTLVHECFELRRNSLEARRHLVQGIAGALDAYSVCEGTGRTSLIGKEELLQRPVMYGPEVVGRTLKQYHDDGLLHTDPFRREVMARGDWTGSRRSLIDDDDWRGSIPHQVRESAGIGDELKSLLSLGANGSFSLVTVQRGLQDPEFTPREIRLLEFIHQAAVGMLKRPVISTAPVRLTPTQRETLGLVLSGMQNKEIARARHCEESSVKDVVKRLFKIFGVENRKELIGRFVDRSVMNDLQQPNADIRRIDEFAVEHHGLWHVKGRRE